MALIECNECGTQVSDKASKCPKCGNPMKPSSSERAKTFFKSKAGKVKRILKARKLKLFIGYILLFLSIIAICGGFIGFTDYCKIHGINHNFMGDYSDYSNAYIYITGKFYTRIAFVLVGLVLLWVAKWCLISKKAVLCNIIYGLIVVLCGIFMANDYIETKSFEEYRLHNMKIEQKAFESSPEFEVIKKSYEKEQAGKELLAQELKGCYSTDVRLLDMPDSLITGYCNELNKLSIKTWNTPLNGLDLKVYQANYENEYGNRTIDRFYVFFKEDKPIKYAKEDFIREGSELKMLFLMKHNFE